MRSRVYFESGQRAAVILFRVREPSLGYDPQSGYFAGLIPETRRVVLGKPDERQWSELPLVEHPVAVKRWHMLRVEAVDDSIRVRVDGKLEISLTDPDHPRGMVGLRVVDTHAWFDDFSVSPR